MTKTMMMMRTIMVMMMLGESKEDNYLDDDNVLNTKPKAQ